MKGLCTVQKDVTKAICFSHSMATLVLAWSILVLTIYKETCLQLPGKLLSVDIGAFFGKTCSFFYELIL